MHPVLLEKEGSVAVIKLNRPEKYNAINRAMALMFQQKLIEAEEDESVRCICITGSGKAFSAGQDLAEAADPMGMGMEKILPEQLNPIVSKLRTIKKPVLAAVNGIAAGAAANIALCCDLVIAVHSSSFIQAFTKIGLVPDSGGTYILPRLVGLQRTAGLMMLAEPVSGKEAEAMGMIYKSFPDDQFEAAAKQIAAQLASMPTAALVYTRMALNKSMNSDFEQQLKNEEKLQMQASLTSDFKEGVRAFLEKRKPDFKGK